MSPCRRQYESTDPDKGTSNQTYDQGDRVVCVTDGRTPPKTIALAYGKLGRLTVTHEGSLTGPKLTEQTYDTPEKDGAPVGTTGYFAFSSGGVTDVTKYEWWTDWDPTIRTVGATAPGGPSKQPQAYKPLNSGPQYLYVRSLDAATTGPTRRSASSIRPVGPSGTSRETSTATVRSTCGPSTPAVGSLWVHPGQGNGKFGTGRTADEASFADAHLTHRGSWDEDYDEDLLALRPGAENPELKELWVHGNRGDGEPAGEKTGSRELSVVLDEDKHWRNADQILSHEPERRRRRRQRQLHPAVVNANDMPDLLVKSGNRLWLYLGAQGSDLLDEFSARHQDRKIHEYSSRRNQTEDNTTVADLSVYGDGDFDNPQPSWHAEPGTW